VNSQIKIHAKPLFEALTQMQFWVQRNHASRLLVAASSRKTLKREDWPEHIKVSKSKPLGRRVAARGSRRILVAFWPDDGYQAARQSSLICVIRGDATLGVADYKLRCRVGDFVLIPQGVPLSAHSHCDINGEQNECDLLWIRPSEEINQLDCWICHSRGETHESGPQYGACWVAKSILSSVFASLCEEAQSDNNAKLNHHLLSSILFLLAREIEQGKAYLPRHHLHESVHDAPVSKPNNPIEEACLYIDEHLDQQLTAARLARHVCISPTLFHLKFKSTKQQSFHQYLTTKRLAKASALLTDSDVPVNEVAGMIGLQYPQLRRLFLEQYKCAPGEFRKRHIRKIVGSRQS
jgi:AraC-like DNA-binding protein